MKPADRARQVRRLAMKILYLLDTRGDADAEAIRKAALAGELVENEEQDTEPISEDIVGEAFDLALAAHRERRRCDEDIRVIAPQWPPARQAAVDRALIRLAHYEMCSGRVNPRIAVNEAVGLAREFGGEHSFAFVNGVLDKVLKRVLASATPPQGA